MQELKDIQELFDNQPDIYLVLDNLQIATQEKIQILNKLFESKATRINIGTIALLAKFNLAKDLGNLISAIENVIYKKENDATDFEIESASNLGLEEIKRITLILEKKEATKFKFIKQTLNPDLIAGFIIRYKNRQIDLSKRAEIIELTEQISQRRYYE
jgi:F0F1-type ATP synthase delta subunit